MTTDTHKRNNILINAALAEAGILYTSADGARRITDITLSVIDVATLSVATQAMLREDLPRHITPAPGHLPEFHHGDVVSLSRSDREGVRCVFCITQTCGSPKRHELLRLEDLNYPADDDVVLILGDNIQIDHMAFVILPPQHGSRNPRLKEL